jgi:hypothetical protein
MNQNQRVRIGLYVALWLLGAGPSSSTSPAQNTLEKDPCHAMAQEGSADARNFLSFDQFDKELRVALAQQDPVALAFLVTFPLRVNDAGGSIAINDASALKTHFQEVFTPAVRKEILNEKNENIGCNVEGIGYARGVIWVNASERGYSIWSVNRDSVAPYTATRWKGPKIEFVCQTQTHRIAIDIAAPEGALRYRSWNKPRPVTGPPDLQITKGDQKFEGTDLCAIPIYRFKSGTAEYTVEGGLGCDPDGPKNATGRLDVTLAGKPATDSWCY